MKDIKELALRFHDTYERLAPSFSYETRHDTKKFDPESPNGKLMCAVVSEFLAAYLKEQGPVDAIDYDIEIDRYYIPVHPNWEVQTKGKGSSFRIARRDCHGERWLVMDKHLHKVLEDMARDINARFTAPPEPAPRPSYTGTCANLHETVQIPNAACAAPSSEEVREMVEKLRRQERTLRFPGTVGAAADLIERLAARVPDGCVVVPRDPTEAMILSGNLMQHGVRAAYKSMIAAGEVK